MAQITVHVHVNRERGVRESVHAKTSTFYLMVPYSCLHKALRMRIEKCHLFRWQLDSGYSSWIDMEIMSSRA